MKKEEENASKFVPLINESKKEREWLKVFVRGEIES